ncbi:MAG TPA: hypothetical protein VN803_06350 [Gemmatimonadales bacterium]|nr:hypothetical protein [Gemmatimonadales bacterium]
MHYVEPHGFYVQADPLEFDAIEAAHIRCDDLHAHRQQPAAVEHGRDWDPELGHTTSTPGGW